MIYKSAIHELLCISPLVMEDVNYWLVKNKNLFNSIVSENSFLLRASPFGVICEMNENRTNFLNYYTNLVQLSKRFKYENYFKDELDYYDRLCVNFEKTRLWVIKNYKIYNEFFVSFDVDYLDYSKNAKNLHVFIPGNKTSSVIVKSDCFENTIRFVEIYNKCLYVDGLHELFD